MNTQAETIFSLVRAAGHWGVLRNEWKQETFDRMAALVGMSGGRCCKFRFELFADGIKHLDTRAITALSIYFNIDRAKLEELNNELAPRYGQALVDDSDEPNSL